MFLFLNRLYAYVRCHFGPVGKMAWYVILAMTAPVLWAGVQPLPIHHIVAFGDSLTDVQNLFQASEGILPISPPHYRGRFSNGPVWIEGLAQLLEKPPHALWVYAYGGAKTHDDGTGFARIPDLQKQIASYQSDVGMADPAALHTVWIGGNDFLHNLEMIVDQTHVQARNPRQTVYGIRGYVQNSVHYVRQALDHLVEMGARHVLVLNLPHLAKTPYVREEDEQRGDRVYSEGYTEITHLFNRLLHQEIEDLQAKHPEVHWIELDVYQKLNAIIENPRQYGIDNVHLPCNLNEVSENDQPVCKHPERYLFWDKIHPTAKAHHQLASDAFIRLHDYYDHLPGPHLLWEADQHVLFRAVPRLFAYDHSARPGWEIPRVSPTYFAGRPPL